MQKALVQMNLQLPVVVSDITGSRLACGSCGTSSPVSTIPPRLAAHRDHRCRASTAEIIAALTGELPA